MFFPGRLIRQLESIPVKFVLRTIPGVFRKPFLTSRKKRLSVNQGQVECERWEARRHPVAHLFAQQFCFGSGECITPVGLISGIGYEDTPGIFTGAAFITEGDLSITKDRGRKPGATHALIITSLIRQQCFFPELVFLGLGDPDRASWLMIVGSSVS